MAAARVRPSVAILGCGAVGEALAMGLVERWEGTRSRGEIALWSRTQSHAARLERRLRKRFRNLRTRIATVAEARDVLARAECVLLSVSDGAIAPLAKELARARVRSRTATVVLHTNGLVGASALAALRSRGLAVGRMHPLVALPATNPRLPGATPFGVEGDARARAVARQLARWLGGWVLPLPAREPGAYHASASLLGGGWVALFELAERVLSRSIRAPARRREALLGLARSVVMNLEVAGARGALTGALARGSSPVVRSHLGALRAERDALAAYRLLGATMLELARARGSIDASAERRLRRLLGHPGRRR